VILFGTASEEPVSDAIAAGITGPSIGLVGKTAIADLPALLSRCQLFVGNDSGAMHVAAAVGLPVVAIFGPPIPTVPRRLQRAAPLFKKGRIAVPASYAAAR